MLLQYAKEDDRIVVRILEKNLGIAGNTNAALEMATGEYIGLLDHDDFLAAGCPFLDCFRDGEPGLAGSSLYG